jgi:hypothetical protein
VPMAAMSLDTTSGSKLTFDRRMEQHYLSSLQSVLLICPRDFPLMGPMCRAWMADDTSVCGKDKKVDVLGVAGIVLAQLVYYYVKSEGKYFHASQNGKKRSVDSVQWDVDPESLAWPSIPADAEEVKRAIVVLDEAGNELARSEKRAIVKLDGNGNELSMHKLKRAVLELDEAGNELFSSRKL